MGSATKKCPHCGAGWAGRQVSSRHVSACAKRNKAALSPSAGSLRPGAVVAEAGAAERQANEASVQSAWGRFKERAASTMGRAKEGAKPGALGGRRRGVAAAAVAMAGVTALSACSSQADVASKNLSTAAEQFEIDRRVVFFNGITDKYLLEIQGRCSVETADSALGGSLEVTCKTGPEEFKKHFLGLSDNVSYFVEQIESADASVYNYRVVFKPDVIVPDIDLDTQVVPSNSDGGPAPSATPSTAPSSTPSN